MCLGGFTNLAKAVSNLIFMIDKLEDDGEKKEELMARGVQLKEDLMKFGTFRLAGGIDSMWADGVSPAQKTVTTESFVIKFTKLGVVNVMQPTDPKTKDNNAVECAKEGEPCKCVGKVRYGTPTKYNEL